MASQTIHASVKLIVVSIVILIHFAASISRAQSSEYFFSNITVDQGLSQNSVYAIVQDQRGFMWFGTKDGLNRYDGYDFVIYKHNPSDSTSLTENSVTVLYEDRAGRLWVSTTNALHLYESRFDRFYRIPLLASVQNKQPRVSVIAITEDTFGNLWLGTIENGLIRLSVVDGPSGDSSFSVTSYLHNPKNRRSIHNNSVTTVYHDREGKLWIGTQGRLQSMNPQSPEQGFDEHRLRVSGYPHDPDVHCVYEDSRGTLWLGTNAGLAKYDRKLSRLEFYEREGSEFVSQSMAIRTICENEKGLLWLGTFGRLILFDPETMRYQTVPKYGDDGNNLFRTGTMQIRRDKSGAFWFGSNGYGVFRYHPILTRFQSYTKTTAEAAGWPGHSVRSLFEDAEGRLWIGSYGGVYTANTQRTQFDRINELGGNIIRGFVRDRHGMLWLATYGLIQFDPRTRTVRRFLHDPSDPTSIRSNEVAAVFRDHTGTIWVVAGGVLSKLENELQRFIHFPLSTPLEVDLVDPAPVGMYEDRLHRIWLATDLGVFRFEATTGNFKHYAHEPGNAHSLSYTATRCVTPDPREPERILWIGTTGGGLNRLDLETEQFTAFTETDGLPNNVVYGILSGSKGNLWLSTNRGIARFDPQTRTFRTFLSQDGLQSNEYNSGAYYKNRHGEMFFGGINGFDVFNPATVQENEYIPPVVLTEFRLFNSLVTLHDPRVSLQAPISEATEVSLSYSQNVFSLTFASLDYTAPEKNLYRYMLEGFDADFGPTSTRRSATYTNLDPGTYTFLVKGSNSDGIWNEEATSLEITVLPPYWMTWWFRALVIVLFLSVGPIIYFRRVSSLKREHARQQEFSRLLIDSQEKERKRIATELHDSLGQGLLVMKNRALLGLQKSPLAEDLREDLAEISNTASVTLKGVREISHNLRPYELDRFGLTETIRSVVEKVQSSSAMIFTAEIDDIDNLLPKESEISIYRVVQECLNNILKHAEATKAEVNIKKLSSAVALVVSDNGKGFDTALLQQGKRSERGLGVDSISERVRIAGGTVKIESADGSGTTITATIPFNPETHGA